VESFLERERGQLPSWLVVGFGAGIASWFALDGPTSGWRSSASASDWQSQDSSSKAADWSGRLAG
jgi:hypothetical protein